MKSYKIALLFTLTFALTANVYSQSNADIKRQIQKEYHRINAIPSLERKSLDAKEFLQNIPDGGAELTGYFKKDSLLKIKEWIGLSYGIQTREFYFLNNKLFFVYEQFDSYVQTKDVLDLTKTKNVFQGRYYFGNGKLIERIVKGKKPMEDEKSDMASNLRSDAEEHFKTLASKQR
jgi:hypothetical protein